MSSSELSFTGGATGVLLAIFGGLFPGATKPALADCIPDVDCEGSTVFLATRILVFLVRVEVAWGNLNVPGLDCWAWFVRDLFTEEPDEGISLFY